MEYFAATQFIDEFVLPTQPDLSAGTEAGPGENITLPPQQVGVLIIDTEQRAELAEHPLFLGCNIIGREVPNVPGADQLREDRVRQWRIENLEPHVEAIFLPEPSISSSHAHIYVEDGGLNCFVTALRTTNPSFMVPAGAAARAHTLTPGVRYNVRPDDVLRFGRLCCRVLCGPDWQAREQLQEQQQKLGMQSSQRQQLQHSPQRQGSLAAQHLWCEDGQEAGLLPERSHHHPRHPLDDIGQQHKQYQGLRLPCTASPGALNRLEANPDTAGVRIGSISGRGGQEASEGVSGGASTGGAVAGYSTPLARAAAVRGGGTRSSGDGVGQPGQQHMAPPTQEVLEPQLPQRRDVQQQQQQQLGPVPLPVMQLISLVPPQGAATGQLGGSGGMTLAHAGAVGPGPPEAYFGPAQARGGAVLVQLHGGAAALLPSGAAAALLPVQVPVPQRGQPMIKVGKEDEEEEEEEEGEEDAAEPAGGAAAASADVRAPGPGVSTVAAPPAPWWEVADSLDDTHDGVWDRSEGAGVAGEGETYLTFWGADGALRRQAEEEAGPDGSSRGLSAPLRAGFEPGRVWGERVGASGALGLRDEGARSGRASGGDDANRRDGGGGCSGGGGDESHGALMALNGDAQGRDGGDGDDDVVYDLTQSPEEEDTDAAADSGLAVVAADAQAQVHVHGQEENDQQLHQGCSQRRPASPDLGPNSAQADHVDDDTAPPSPSPLHSSSHELGHQSSKSADGADSEISGRHSEIVDAGDAIVYDHALGRSPQPGASAARLATQMPTAWAPTIMATQPVDPSGPVAGCVLLPTAAARTAGSGGGGGGILHGTIQAAAEQPGGGEIPATVLLCPDDEDTLPQASVQQPQRQLQQPHLPPPPPPPLRNDLGHMDCGTALSPPPPPPPPGPHQQLEEQGKRLVGGGGHGGMMDSGDGGGCAHADLTDGIDGGGCRRLLLGILSDPTPTSSPSPQPAGAIAEELNCRMGLQPQHLTSTHPSPPVHLPQRAEHLPQQSRPSLPPQTAAAAVLSQTLPPPPSALHGRDLCAPALVRAAGAEATMTAVAVAAAAAVAPAETFPAVAGPSMSASLGMSQGASPWDAAAAQQRVGRLVSLLGSLESSGPSQGGESQEPIQLLRLAANLLAPVLNADSAGVPFGKGPNKAGHRSSVDEMAPSGHEGALGRGVQQPLVQQLPPGQQQQQQQGFQEAAADTVARLQQPAPAAPSPLPAVLGSPTGSFMMPGFGTQIAADALQELMMAESAPGGHREQSPGPRSGASVGVFQGARRVSLFEVATADYDYADSGGVALQVPGRGAQRGSGRLGGGRSRGGGRSGGRAQQYGYSNSDYVYEFPADAGDNDDEDYVQTPPRGRGRGRGRGARGGRGRGGRGSKATSVAARPPAGPSRTAGTKRRSSVTSAEASPTADATAVISVAPAAPPGKSARRSSKDGSSMRRGHPAELHQQNQTNLQMLSVQLPPLQGAQQQQQQHMYEEVLFFRDDEQRRAHSEQLQPQCQIPQQQQSLLGAVSTGIPQLGPANGTRGYGPGAPLGHGNGHAVFAAAAADLARALAGIPPAVEEVHRDRDGMGAGAEAPEAGRPVLQWATRRRRTSGSLSREGSVDLSKASGSAELPPPPQLWPPVQSQRAPPQQQQQQQPAPRNQKQALNLAREDQLQNASLGGASGDGDGDGNCDGNCDDDGDGDGDGNGDSDPSIHRIDFVQSRPELLPVPGSPQGDGTAALGGDAAAAALHTEGEPAAIRPASEPVRQSWLRSNAPLETCAAAVPAHRGREPLLMEGTSSNAAGAAAAAAHRPFKRPRIMDAAQDPAAHGTAPNPKQSPPPPSTIEAEASGKGSAHGVTKPLSPRHVGQEQQQLEKPALKGEGEGEKEDGELKKQEGALRAKQLGPQLPLEQACSQQAVRQLPPRTPGSVRGGLYLAGTLIKRTAKRKAEALDEETEQVPDQQTAPEPEVEVRPAAGATGLTQALWDVPPHSPCPGRNATSAAGRGDALGPALEEQVTPRGVAAPPRGLDLRGRPPLLRLPRVEDQMQSDDGEEQQQPSAQPRAGRSSNWETGKAAKRGSAGGRKARVSKARDEASEGAAAAAAGGGGGGGGGGKANVCGPSGHDRDVSTSPQPSRNGNSPVGPATALRRRRGGSFGAGGSQPGAVDAGGGGGGGGGSAAGNAAAAVVVSISRNIPDRERSGLAAAVQRLGGRVAEDDEADAGGFTHLLLARGAFTTSMKVLAALAAGRPLLDAAWLDACRAAGMWLEPQPEHAAVDPKAEKQHKFRIWDAYQTARREGLMLKGRSFYATPLRVLEDAKKAPVGGGAGGAAAGGGRAGKTGGRSSTGGAGRSSSAAALGTPIIAAVAAGGIGSVFPNPPQGLTLIAQLAGARVLGDAREVVADETVVLGQPGELRWARQHLPVGTRVYDKDGFVQALLHQRLDGVKPAFVV